MASDKVKAGRAIVSWILPPVGIVTYFMERDQHPKKAKNYLMISLASIVFYGAAAIIHNKSKNK